MTKNREIWGEPTPYQTRTIEQTDSVVDSIIDQFVERAKFGKEKYNTDLDRTGQCNYAFTVILRKPDMDERNKIETMLHENNIEFRRGLSGGGNQLRQPYVERYGLSVSDEKLANQFANVEHVHNYSWYIGNYPSLERDKITNLLALLNN